MWHTSDDQLASNPILIKERFEFSRHIFSPSIWMKAQDGKVELCFDWFSKALEPRLNIRLMCDRVNLGESQTVVYKSEEVATANPLRSGQWPAHIRVDEFQGSRCHCEWQLRNACPMLFDHDTSFTRNTKRSDHMAQPLKVNVTKASIPNVGWVRLSEMTQLNHHWSTRKLKHTCRGHLSMCECRSRQLVEAYKSAPPCKNVHQRW